MGESIHDALKRRERLSTLQGVIANQRAVLEALRAARVFSYQVDEDWQRRLDAIGGQVAIEVVLSAEAIYELSGPQERAR